MNEEEKNNELASKIGNKIGAFFAYVIAGCGVSIAVAVTAKFIFWLLF